MLIAAELYMMLLDRIHDVVIKIQYLDIHHSQSFASILQITHDYAVYNNRYNDMTITNLLVGTPITLATPNWTSAGH